MARIIFEYDKFDKNNKRIDGIYTRRLNLSAMSEILNDSPQTLVNALCILSDLSKAESEAHLTVCNDYRNANPERYSRIMDSCMAVSVFNENKSNSIPRNPVMSKSDLIKALKSLKKK